MKGRLGKWLAVLLSVSMLAGTAPVYGADISMESDFSSGAAETEAQPDVPEEKLQRMLTIVRTEKHRVAPNCATCAMPCGNTTDYDLTRLWNAPQAVRTLKLLMLAAAIRLAQQHPSGDRQTAVYQVLFTLAEDWDEALLLPVVQRAEELCGE